MAVNIITVGFGQYPSDGIGDILKYAGFDPVIRGKLLRGEIIQYRSPPTEGGANILIFRVLEEDIVSPNVPIVFTDALKDGDETGESLDIARIAQILEVVRQIRDHIEFEETPNDIFSSLGDGM